MAEGTRCATIGRISFVIARSICDWVIESGNSILPRPSMLTIGMPGSLHARGLVDEIGAAAGRRLQRAAGGGDLYGGFAFCEQGSQAGMSELRKIFTREMPQGFLGR